MKIPVYPNDFYSFHDGVNIDNKTINEWIKKCIDNLEENKNRESTTISSGNTKVIVDRWFSDSGNEYYYEVTVAKRFSDAETDLLEI